MASLTARITYSSRRQFFLTKDGASATLHFERRGRDRSLFFIGTHNQGGKPAGGESNFSLECDEETARALRAALGEMLSRTEQAP